MIGRIETMKKAVFKHFNTAVTIETRAMFFFTFGRDRIDLQKLGRVVYLYSTSITNWGHFMFLVIFPEKKSYKMKTLAN